LHRDAGSITGEIPVGENIPKPARLPALSVPETGRACAGCVDGARCFLPWQVYRIQSTAAY